MASSKFARRPRIQQPPPVCRSGKIPIPPTPPPPPIHKRLWMEGNWDGLCSDGTHRSFSRTIEFPQEFPQLAGMYSYTDIIDGVTFQAVVTDAGWPDWNVDWNWLTGSWHADAEAYWPWTTTPPVDTGVLPALETDPFAQTANFHLYTTP